MSPLAEFADKIHEILPVIMREFARRQVNELCKGKITLPQFLILEFLHREGDSGMSRIASFMQVSTAAITGFMDRLVREGYVVRIYNPKDRRAINAKLTSKGNKLVTKINEQRRQMILCTFGKVSETDRNDYLRVLTKIRDILSRES
jgi:DNA-binding MarR family transcriptional regulator